MSSFFKSFLLLFSLMMISCSSADEPYIPPETASEPFNQMLRQAPISLISLNNVPIDTLKVPTDHFFEEQLFVNDTLYVNRPTHLTLFNNYLITIEFGSGNVTALSNQGTPVRRVGRSGRGPAEFEYPRALGTDGEHLYVYDHGLKRLTLFDRDFNVHKTVPLDEIAFNQQQVSINSSYLVFQNQDASSMHAPEPDLGMIDIRPIDRPDSTITSIIGRIVPPGMQPSVHNIMMTSLNSRNSLLAAFSGLPYLFLYSSDDFTPTHTIALEAAHFDTLDNPSLRPFPPVGSDGFGARSLYSTFYLMDNEDILMVSFRLLHHLKRTENGGYLHHRSYYMEHEESGEQIMTIQSLASSPSVPNRYYAVGWGNMFVLDLK